MVDLDVVTCGERVLNTLDSEQRLPGALADFASCLRESLLHRLNAEESDLSSTTDDEAALLRRDHIRLRSAVALFERWAGGQHIPHPREVEAAVRSFLVQYRRHLARERPTRRCRSEHRDRLAAGARG